MVEIEDEPLMLPSSLLPEPRRLCKYNVAIIEEKIRSSHINSRLTTVRNIICLKSSMITFKNTHVRGQKEGTRSRALIDNVQSKLRFAAQSYETTRKALRLLVPDLTKFDDMYRTLEKQDLVAFQGRPRKNPTNNKVPIQPELTDPEDIHLQKHKTPKMTGETKREVSWIWRVGQSEEFSDGDKAKVSNASKSPLNSLVCDCSYPRLPVLRVEFLQSRARAQRWGEEILLLKEEMRRTLEYIKWKAAQWELGVESLAVMQTAAVFDQRVIAGIRAYAHKQAAQQRGLGDKFKRLWSTDENALAEDINWDVGDVMGDDDE